METKRESGDKRLSPRVRLLSRVRYRVIPGSDSRFQDATAQDLSQTGFRFHSKEFIPKKSSIVVEMEFVGHAPIRSVAQAVWVRERPLDDGYEVGSRFVEPPRGARTTLDRITSPRGG